MNKSRLLLLREDMALNESSFDIVPSAMDIFRDFESDETYLKTETISTHSGLLINNRVYPGVNMRRSVKTWLTPDKGGTAAYERPMLLNHDLFGKAIGRVVGAKFTATAQGNAFKNDFLTPMVIDRGEPNDIMGTGYISTTSILTDQDAIAGVLKGEYKSTSVSFNTDKAICSICGSDFLQGNKYCGHWPGDTYDVEVKDGKKTKVVRMFCFAITGNMVFREQSYVNAPADAAAQTVKMEKISLDNVDGECYSIRTVSDNASIASVTLCDSEGNSISRELLNFGEELMTTQAKKSGKTVIAVNSDIKDAITRDILSDEPETSIDDNASDGTDNSTDQDTTPAEKIESKEEPANSDADDSSEADVSLSDEDFALANVARSMGTCLLDADSDELSAVLSDSKIEGEGHTHRVITIKDGDTLFGTTYDFEGDGADHFHVVENEDAVTRGANTGPDHTHEFELVENKWDTPDAETLKTLVEKLDSLEEDDKLSDEQKKVLVDNKDFCGPNRSFPVTDKFHVGAAFRLLPRYKGRSDVKSRIASKLRDFGGTMGYFEDTTDTSKEEREEAESKVTTGDDSLLADYVRKSADLGNEVSQLKGQLSDKTEEVKALTDASVETHKMLNKALAQQLVIARWVLDKDDTIRVKDAEAFDGLIEKYAGRSAESLVDSINDLVAELDIYLRDHRGGINTKILNSTREKIEEDETKKQVVKNEDKTNMKSNIKVKKPVRKTAVESLTDDLQDESRSRP